ncbi:hypothetical protein PSHT_14420 [Puccinia striiformis]|uniref:Uncharacterized protein n=1 Tax=Puccinia striiformis TaxID=27350 RepID=A0A2S4UJY7_9BASI|nr:hypothetical protein PSHT_14420 [Puccinia striiformis]
MSLFHYVSVLSYITTTLPSNDNLLYRPCCAGIDPKMVPLVDGMLSWDAWCPVSLSQDHRYRDNLAVVGKEYAAPLSAMFYKHLLDFK